MYNHWKLNNTGFGEILLRGNWRVVRKSVKGVPYFFCFIALVFKNFKIYTPLYIYGFCKGRLS
jgi:hypothetical protein